MAKEYEMNTDGDAVRVDDSHLPRVLDPVMTMEIVQRYIDTERNRTRRVMLWLSSMFLLVILAILAIFLSLGIFVLRNSRSAAELAGVAHVQAMAYAADMVDMSNRIDVILDRSDQISNLLDKRETVRMKEGSILKSDLERFSRWIMQGKDEDTRQIETLRMKLAEMEDLLKLYREKTEKPAPVSAGQAVETSSAPAGGTRMGPPQENVFNAGVDPAPDQASASVPETTPGDFIGKLSDPAPGPEIAMIRPEEIKIPVPPAGAGENITVLTFPNGDKYKGMFKEGLFHGWGEYDYKNGDRYEGYFRNDMKAGEGTFIYASGDKYIGGFSNDQKNGRGMMLFGNNDRYVGEFKADMITGRGIMSYAGGSRYSGSFKNGLKDGFGILVYPNGDTYKGEFAEDVRSGKGNYVFSDGSKYIGEFKRDKRHGKGRYIYSSGDEYNGEFKDGLKHGEGIGIYPDGKQIKGIWREDKLVTVLE